MGRQFQNQGRSHETVHAKARDLKESMLHISVGDHHDHGFYHLQYAAPKFVCLGYSDSAATLTASSGKNVKDLLHVAIGGG